MRSDAEVYLRASARLIELVRPIHNSVPGRVRYKVIGLYRSVALKYRLEMLLLEDPQVGQVSASILTGNVLIIFDPHCNPRKIASHVEQIAVTYQQEIEVSQAENGSGLFPQRVPAPVTELRVTRRNKDEPYVFATREQETKPWHLMAAKFVLASLNSSKKKGLSAEAAKTSLKQYGLNVVPEPLSRSKWGIFIDQFMSLPVALLSAAAGLSVVTGGVADAIVIMAVVGINSVIGFVTENEAEKTINSLKKLIRPYAQIVRGGSSLEIPAEQVSGGRHSCAQARDIRNCGREACRSKSFNCRRIGAHRRKHAR